MSYKEKAQSIKRDLALNAARNGLSVVTNHLYTGTGLRDTRYDHLYEAADGVVAEVTGYRDPVWYMDYDPALGTRLSTTTLLEERRDNGTAHRLSIDAPTVQNREQEILLLLGATNRRTVTAPLVSRDLPDSDDTVELNLHRIQNFKVETWDSNLGVHVIKETDKKAETVVFYARTIQYASGRRAA
jgi:hypothetical protein